MKRSSGFTLIEICIVIIISGLLLTAIVAAADQFYKQQRIYKTETNIEKVQAAVTEFFSTYGHYPCPARATAQPGQADYGVAQNCAALTGDVVTGIVPFSALNTATPDPADYVDVTTASRTQDGWGNRFTYAVTRAMAIDATQFGTAMDKVTLNNLDGGAAVQTRYVLFSHGPDGTGAYTAQGTEALACDTAANTKDSENCDDDETFAQSEKRSTKEGADRYDDFLVLREAGSSSAGPVVTNSCNFAAGEIVVGIADGVIQCAVVPQNLCAIKGMIYDPSDLSADADGCTLKSGEKAGYCIQKLTSIGGTYGFKTYTGIYAEEPAYMQSSNPTFGITNCLCRPGYKMTTIGDCRSDSTTDGASCLTGIKKPDGSDYGQGVLATRYRECIKE